jgi:hypothetical protein
MRTNKENRRGVTEICNVATNKYDVVLKNVNIHRLKEAFALALYKVESLPSAPVATTDYLDAVDEANAAVNALRRISEDVSETHFSTADMTSTETSEDAEHPSAGKRMEDDDARLTLIREMQLYEKWMATIMAGAACPEDEGQLVTASRAALISAKQTKRTYFDGLLSGAGWKPDAIGMCAMTLKYDLCNNECM